MVYLSPGTYSHEAGTVHYCSFHSLFFNSIKAFIFISLNLSLFFFFNTPPGFLPRAGTCTTAPFPVFNRGWKTWREKGDRETSVAPLMKPPLPRRWGLWGEGVEPGCLWALYRAGHHLVMKTFMSTFFFKQLQIHKYRRIHPCLLFIRFLQWGHLAYPHIT